MPSVGGLQHEGMPAGVGTGVGGAGVGGTGVGGTGVGLGVSGTGVGGTGVGAGVGFWKQRWGCSTPLLVVEAGSYFRLVHSGFR